MNKYGISEAKSRVGFKKHTVPNSAVTGSRRSLGAWVARSAVFVTVFSLAFSSFVPTNFALATNNDGDNDKKIEICHATNSHTNPYNKIEVAKNAVLSAHGDHTGPVWYSGINEKWGDIIPAFDDFPGLNWDDTGKKIHKEKDCGGEQVLVCLLDGGTKLFSGKNAKKDAEKFVKDEKNEGSYISENGRCGEVLPCDTDNAQTNPDCEEPNPCDISIQAVNNDCPPTEPKTTNIHFHKYLCEDYSDVYGNKDAGNFDETNGNSGELANAPGFNGVVKPVNPNNNNEVLAGCELAKNDWYFNLSDNVDGNYNQTGFQQQVGPTVDGVYSTTVSALPDELKTAIKSGKLWVSEVKQNAYPFAAIRCYNDALNGDNLEFITLGEQTPNDIYCIAYNIGKNPRLPQPCGTELILNGGFEAPVVATSQKWNIYDSGSTDLEWEADWVRPAGAPDVAHVELHRNSVSANWVAHEGSQYTELDSDWGGPTSNQSGEDASIKLYQDIPTTAGKKYTLTFAASPRPGQVAANNAIKVTAGDLDVTVNSIAIPNSGDATVWTEYTFSFIASSTTTRVQFEDVGPGDSFGGFLDDVSVKEDCATDIEVCKIDYKTQQPLPGWEVFLKGEEVDSVKVYPDGTIYSSDVLPAGDYVLEASGTYVYRPGSSGDISDAGYTKREPGEFGATAENPWINVNSLPGEWAGYLGIQVDGVNPNWGPLNLVNHKYSSNKTLIAGDEIDFRILDSYYGDNSGFLTVDIFPIYKGTTGENGCVTIKNVPFGDYYLDEIMKEGWEYVSGAGEVVIDEQTTKFTLVNKCTTACEPEPCKDGPAWASAYHEFNQGKRKNGTDVLAARSDASKALGEAQNNDTENFVSLGFGGSIILSFGGVFQNVPGTDIKLVETSYGNPSDTNYPEKVKVEVSMSMAGPWTNLGEFFQDEDIEMGAVQYAKYIKLTDVSDKTSSKFDGVTDGYDVDGVQVSLVLCDEPEFKVSGMKYKDLNKNGKKNGIFEHGIWNWKIYLMKQVETFDVAAFNTPVVSSSSLTSTVDYMVKVTGTYNAGDGIEADAKYSERNSSGFWTDLVQNYEVYGPTLLDLQIDGSSPNWGMYNSAHTYWTTITGDGTPADFQIYDTFGSNNTGELEVTIYEILDVDYTNIWGQYEFDITGLEGELVIAEEHKTGWMQSAPNTIVHTLDAGKNHKNKDFGNYPVCTVKDFKYDSKFGKLIGFILGLMKKDGLPTCGNGIYGQKQVQNTEANASGWTIYVDLNQNGALDDGEPYDITDSEGNYFFANLPTGTYQVREVNQSGWTQVSPEGFHSVTLDKQIDGIKGPYNFVNRLDDTPTEPNGYNIRGAIYHDVNNNRNFDVEDPDLGLENWIAYIDSINNDALDAEEPFGISDENGNYQILNLPAGCHTVREVLQSGWEITEPNPSHEYIIALGVPFETCPGAVNGLVELVPSGEDVTFWDGLIKTAHAEIVYTVSDLNFGNYPIDRGGNPGGGGSSGTRIPNPDEGRVAGDSTSLPYENPQVLGEVTTLPRTGTPLSIVFSFIAILGIIILPKLSIAKAD